MISPLPLTEVSVGQLFLYVAQYKLDAERRFHSQLHVEYNDILCVHLMEQWTEVQLYWLMI